MLSYPNVEGKYGNRAPDKLILFSYFFLKKVASLNKKNLRRSNLEKILALDKVLFPQPENIDIFLISLLKLILVLL